MKLSSLKKKKTPKIKLKLLCISKQCSSHQKFFIHIGNFHKQANKKDIPDSVKYFMTRIKTCRTV